MLTVSQSSDATLDLESRGFSLPDAQGQQIALPNAREEDGACGMWLEKKSPSKVRGWQRRWSVPPKPSRDLSVSWMTVGFCGARFVIHPGGKVLYYTDPKKEALRTPQRVRPAPLHLCDSSGARSSFDSGLLLCFGCRTSRCFR